MTTSSELLCLAARELKALGATAAGQRVYTPGDWPTWDNQYPALKLRVVNEEKISVGRSGPPEFTVTATVRILGQVSAPAAAEDGGAAAAEDQLWRLARQVEVALINSYPLTSKLQQFPFVRTQLAFSSEGETHLGGIQIDLGLEFFQDDFAPIDADDLDEINLTAANYPNAGFDAVLPS